MRKALMGLVMAATVMTPLAAQAQERGNRGGGEARQERAQERAERFQTRVQQRQERQESPRPQVQRQPQAQQQQPSSVAVVQRGERRGGGDGYRGGGDRNRGDRGDRGGRGDGNQGGNQGTTNSGYQRGWQGSNDPRYRQDADRYNRRAQENAIRYGTPAQRQDAIRDARRDGNDWRQWDRRRDDRRDDRRDWRNDRRDDRRADRRDWDRDWNRGWRNDRRYNWQDWRYRNRNLYRVSPYYSPYRNWGYQRFSIGIFLEPLFYGQNYWIGDPWQYRLPPAPPGTQWIRYYDDVLLVDTYSGRVVDVIYDFFWR